MQKRQTGLERNTVIPIVDHRVLNHYIVTAIDVPTVFEKLVQGLS